MTTDASIAGEDPEEEIAGLVRTLHETQQRLQELAGGELDAVLLPGGQSYLLHEAQEKLRRGEAAQHHLAVTQTAILNALPAHIALLDRDGVIVSVNNSWHRFAVENGFKGTATTMGQNYLEVCDRARGRGAEEAQEAAAGIRAIMSGASTSEFLLEYPCHSPREKRWFLLRVNPVEKAGPGGAVVMHVNITERKLAEERRVASEDLLRQFIRHTPAAIAMMDPQMRYLQVSDQWMQDYHLAGREIIGRSHYEIFPDLPAEWKEIHQRVLAGAVSQCDEAHFSRADGSTEWLQWDVRPWHEAGGEIGGLLMFTQVITERKRTEEALRENEERLRFLNDLGEATGRLADPSEIMAVMARMLGERLRASRCAYADVEPDGEQFTIQHDYTDRCASSVGDYRLSLFGARAVAMLRGGQALIIRDVDAELLPDDGADTFNAIGIKAIISCPLVKEGRLRALMAVHQATPRDWQPGEIAIVEEVVERCWATLEQKRAEAALRESEERFRQISVDLAKVLDSSLDVICTFDAEGRFIQVSAACERVWGYRPEELLGTLFLDKVHPEDWEKTRAADAGILAGNPVSSFENRYVRKNGSVVHIVWSAWWSEADQSNFCVAHDNTEAHQATAATRELAQRLELAAKASGVGIWDWDLAAGVMHWDDQMYALYGATRTDAPSGIELWRRHLHPDDAGRANAEIAEALQPGGRPFDTVFRIVVSPDGETRHIHGQSRVFRDAADRPLRMLGTNWDVTEQVEREEILRQKLENERTLLQEARAGEKAKREFLAVMSHEIRTPMNGILGFAEMLADSPTLTPEDRDLSRTIASSGDALLRILDDILDFSRIEAGRVAVEKQAFSPQELVRGIEAIFAPQIQKKGLEFRISMAEGVPESLLGDAGRIRQILLNLVGNALKFTERGSIQVSVHPPVDATADGLEFVVRDTGAGVAPEQVQAIFEAFTQADSSTARHHGGTGLGLTISRRLAELMGGTLRLKSRFGEGTAFTLRLPLAAACPMEKGPPVGGDSITAAAVKIALRPALRILVAEDDRVNLKLIVSMLSKLGYEALAARNGVEAIAVYEREEIDCILMDLQMPEMDGIAATRAIREMESSRSVRPVFIAALTANILPEDRQRCFDAGMNAYMNKPVKVQAIADALIEAIEFRTPVCDAV